VVVVQAQQLDICNVALALRSEQGSAVSGSPWQSYDHAGGADIFSRLPPLDLYRHRIENWLSTIPWDCNDRVHRKTCGQCEKRDSLSHSTSTTVVSRR